MPAAFPRAVGMPSVQVLGQEARQVRQGGQKRDFHVALTGQALQHGGHRERDSVVSRRRKEMAERDQADVTSTKCLPKADSRTAVTAFVLRAELPNNPS